MKKLVYVNKGRDPLKETVEGILDSRPGSLTTVENKYSHICMKADLPENRVRVLVNGGGGRGPFFEGCVGDGLADAAVSGDFNCAPNAYMIYQIAKQIDCGKGVLLVTNNFMGDYLNNDMAKELLEADGIPVEVCYVSDDIYSARGEEKEARGGLCGIGFILKISAAAAKSGSDLQEVYRIVEKANSRIRSLAFCYNEDTGNIELGNGFSGEAPAEIIALADADKITEKIVGVILGELEIYEKKNIHIMMNRMLYMSYAEGYIMLHAAKREFEKRGYKTGICTAGLYFDAFDYNGGILSVLITDDELEQYVNPVNGFDFTI